MIAFARFDAIQSITVHVRKQNVGDGREDRRFDNVKKKQYTLPPQTHRGIMKAIVQILLNSVQLHFCCYFSLNGTVLE